MASPGRPEPAPGGDVPSEMPPRPFPGEHPLGSDEPSAPFEGPPIADPAGPGIDPEHPPETPTDPGGRAA